MRMVRIVGLKEILNRRGVKNDGRESRKGRYQKAVRLPVLCRQGR